MCSIDINLKLNTCTYLCIELLDVFVFILKNKMALPLEVKEINFKQKFKKSVKSFLSSNARDTCTI